MTPATTNASGCIPSSPRLVVDAGYSSWRGRSIEHVVREALSRLLLDSDWVGVAEVGGWWPRSNTPEIDLVGADRRPAMHVSFVGTIKWRADRPVAAGDIAQLMRDAQSVPGVGPRTPLVAVCPGGIADRIGAAWNADDLLHAWS